jgi:hypothetical protein
VTVDAGCELCGSRTHPMYRVCGNRAMALVAQLIDIGHVQQSSVLRSMRCVAGEASFCPYGGVLVDEGSTRLCMALGADRILIRGQLDIVVLERAVRIMAVAALDYAFIHLVMEGHVKRRLDVCVASKAKGRLGGLQQSGFGSRGVDAVATQATYVCLGVRRAEEVGVGVGMATQAGCIHLLGGHFVESRDLGDVTACIDVGLAGTMATFAGGASPTML